MDTNASRGKYEMNLENIPDLIVSLLFFDHHLPKIRYNLAKLLAKTKWFLFAEAPCRSVLLLVQCLLIDGLLHLIHWGRTRRDVPTHDIRYIKRIGDRILNVARYGMTCPLTLPVTSAPSLLISKKLLMPNSTTRTPAPNTGYEHHQRTPPTDKNLPHPNILTCRDVGLLAGHILSVQSNQFVQSKMQTVQSKIRNCAVTFLWITMRNSETTNVRPNIYAYWCEFSIPVALKQPLQS